MDYSIVGTDDQIPDYVNDTLFIVTVGHIKDAALRIKLHQKIVVAGGTLATIVASTAHVSKYAQIGEGSVIMHQAVVNADVIIGKGCIINTFANIEHDAKIGDYCHISTGAMINGNCVVEMKPFWQPVGHGQRVRDYFGCVIGAGSLVRKMPRKKGLFRKSGDTQN